MLDQCRFGTFGAFGHRSHSGVDENMNAVELPQNEWHYCCDCKDDNCQQSYHLRSRSRISVRTVWMLFNSTLTPRMEDSSWVASGVPSGFRAA